MPDEPPNSVRAAYVAESPAGYYKRDGANYRNPHEPQIAGLLRQIVRDWPLEWAHVLDLAAGSGEATLALQLALAQRVTPIRATTRPSTTTPPSHATTPIPMPIPSKPPASSRTTPSMMLMTPTTASPIPPLPPIPSKPPSRPATSSPPPVGIDALPRPPLSQPPAHSTPPPHAVPVSPAPPRFTATDPYTYAAYQDRVGRACERDGFEQIAAGLWQGRRFSLIVCSFALHLAEPSRLPGVAMALAQLAPALLILTPHKRPELRDAWGWQLTHETVRQRVRARLYARR